MRWLLFLSRLAFICGVFLLLAISLRIKNWVNEESLTSTIIIIGYFMGLIIIPVTNLCYFFVLIIKKRIGIALWLVAANILFLLVLVYYIFSLNDPGYY